MNSPRKRSAPKADESVVTGAVKRTLTAMLGCEPLGLSGAGIDPGVLVKSLVGGAPVSFSELLAAAQAADLSPAQPEAAKRKAGEDEDDDADEDEDVVADDDEEEEEDEELDEDEDEEDEDEEDDEDDEDEEEEEFDDPDDDDDYDEDEDDEEFEEEE